MKGLQGSVPSVVASRGRGETPSEGRDAGDVIGRPS